MFIVTKGNHLLDNSLMKRMAGILVLCIGLLGSGLPSAGAIFGLSSCEKLKSRTLAEESIGKGLWKAFNRDNIQNNKTTGTTWNYQIVNDLVLLFESDQKVFSDMTKYPRCFNSSQNVFLRKNLQLTNNAITDLNKALADNRDGSLNWVHSTYQGDYDSYSEIYQDLKKIK